MKQEKNDKMIEKITETINRFEFVKFTSCLYRFIDAKVIFSFFSDRIYTYFQ